MGKRQIFIILILLIILFPIISSTKFEIKSNFDRGETLIAELSGYFLEPVLKEDISFYRGHIRIPMEYDIAKIEEDYYIYANLLGKVSGNYSIVIEGVRRVELTETTEEDIIKNFSIMETWADFSVNPGFVVSEDDFSINVRDILDEDIVVNAKINPGESETNLDPVTVKAGQDEKINFPLSFFEQGFNIIELSTENLKYEIPVQAFFTTEEQKKEKGFKFEPSESNISVSTNSNTTRIFYLYNTGDEILYNISISASNFLEPYITFSESNIEELENDSNIAIKVFILASNEEQNLQGHIKAKTPEALATYSEISLSFLESYVPTEEETTPASAKTCSELNGEICDEDEICEEGEIYAKDNKCCLGGCVKEKKNNTGKIIGWVIIILVLAVIIWFFRRHKKAKKPVNLLNVAKGKK